MANHARTPTSAADVTKYQMWALKAFLKGEIGGATQGLWTHFASSDSSTAGIDSTDRWGSSYDATKIVRAAGASPHSWIVLKSPLMDGYSWYLTLAYNTAADTSIKVYWSRTAPTGGSTTARPTATDEWGNGNKDLQQLNDGTSTAFKLHAGLHAGGGFYFFYLKDASGFVSLAFVCDILIDASSSDTYKLYTYSRYQSTSPGPLALKHLAEVSIIDTTMTAGSMRNQIGSSVVSAAVMPPAYFVSGSIFDLGAQSSYDIVRTDGSYWDYPIYVNSYDTTASYSWGFRGRLVDYSFAPTSSISQGTVEPTSVAPQSVIVGNVWAPVDSILYFL